MMLTWEDTSGYIDVGCLWGAAVFRRVPAAADPLDANELQGGHDRSFTQIKGR